MTEKEITLLSQWLYNKLSASMKAGTVTSEKPIVLSKVIERYNEVYQAKATDVDVRKAIRQARKLRLTIATDGYGCWIAEKSSELNNAIKNLKEQIEEMSTTLRELEALRAEMYEEETRLPIEQHPVADK